MGVRSSSMRGLAAIVLLAGLVVPVTAQIRALDPGTFHPAVDSPGGVLVLFEAPWCGHCRVLAPSWALLAQTFGGSSMVSIATVDAETHSELAEEQNVRGFPTIKYYPGSGAAPEDYIGGRAAQDFIDYINKKTGLTRAVPPPASAVQKLELANFQTLLDGAAVSLVKFFAPWCSHCQEMEPAFNQVAYSLAREHSVVIAEVDCDSEQVLCKKHGVTSFPTLLLYTQGQAPGTPYEGGRSSPELLKIVNEQAGTQRTIGGMLGPMAGRSNALDQIVKGFANKSAQVQEALLESTARAVQAEVPLAAAYMALAEKTFTSDKSWPIAEISRLERLIESEAVSGNKLDKFVIKRNTLKAFL